jgi:putative sigma-54 modulation protein
MNIKIRSANFDLTPAVDEYIDKKIASLGKFIPNESEVICDVEIGKTTEHHRSGDIFKAEVNMDIPGGSQIYAMAEAGDIYSAIDVVRDEAEREIVSRKNRYKTLLRKGAGRVKNLMKSLNFRRRV